MDTVTAKKIDLINQGYSPASSFIVYDMLRNDTHVIFWCIESKRYMVQEHTRRIGNIIWKLKYLK